MCTQHNRLNGLLSRLLGQLGLFGGHPLYTRSRKQRRKSLESRVMGLHGMHVMDLAGPSLCDTVW